MAERILGYEMTLSTPQGVLKSSKGVRPVNCSVGGTLYGMLSVRAQLFLLYQPTELVLDEIVDTSPGSRSRLPVIFFGAPCFNDAASNIRNLIPAHHR